MKAPDSQKGSKFILLASIAAAAMLLAGYFVFGRFFKSDDTGLGEINRVTSEQLSGKSLDLSILQDQRFVGLKKVEVDIPALSAIEVGSENPFGTGN